MLAPIVPTFTLELGPFTDKNDKPLTDATVTIELGSESIVVQTGSDGTVTFDSVPENWKGENIDITILKEGYETKVLTEKPVTDQGNVELSDDELTIGEVTKEGPTPSWIFIVIIIAVILIVVIPFLLVNKKPLEELPESEEPIEEIGKEGEVIEEEVPPPPPDEEELP